MSVFRGICTAMITPFDGDNNVDYAAFGRMLDMQLESGVNAVLVCGTTGEPSTMSEKEKLGITEFAAKRINKRVPLLVGIGGNNTAEAISFAKEAQIIGADALLSVTPYYNKTTQNGLVAHYSEICNKTILPVIAYNVPSRTGVNIQPETMAKLAEIPNIVGLKDATGNMAQCIETLSLCGERLDIYAGNDDISVPMYSVGAKGTISVASNIVPEIMVKMAKAFFDGDVGTASELQIRLYPLIKALFSEVNPIPVKTAAAHIGLCNGNLRLPLVPMEEKNKEKLFGILDEYMRNKSE